MNHVGTIRLETDRLIIRCFNLDDAESVFYNWASDDEVTKYLTWPSYKSVEVSREYMNFCVNRYENLTFYQWGIELKDTHELIGSISVVKIMDELDCLGLGWAIGRK